MSIKITHDLISHVAKLGMLKVNHNEIENYQSHFEEIIKIFSDLELVNTENVLPFTNPMREYPSFFSNHMDLREDVQKNDSDLKLNQLKNEIVLGLGE